MLKIGIIGFGVVGSAIYEGFKLKGLTEINLIVYDKYKKIGDIENMKYADFIFIALPTPYNEQLHTYDKTSLDETLEKLNKMCYDGVILIKSTVVPYTTQTYARQYPYLKLVHNPEFLSALTATQDFINQKQIICGLSTNISCKDEHNIKTFYELYFPDASVSICESNESESTKIFVNSFYAVKVQFMTELQQLCNVTNIDYNRVRELMLNNGWINPMHTNVPGSDGNISYGGMCFPKDTNALNEYMKELDTPHSILDACIKERNKMRKD